MKKTTSRNTTKQLVLLQHRIFYKQLMLSNMHKPNSTTSKLAMKLKSKIVIRQK